MLSLVSTGLAPAGASAQEATPRFEPAACPAAHVEIPAGDRVDCGYLVVPELHGQPDGRTLRLAVAILRSPAAAPEPAPIVFLNGGPGLGALDWMGYFLTETGPLRARHDIILLDQRGTGYSEPDLRCPEFNEWAVATRGARLSTAESVAGQARAAARCRERLLAQGVNLAAFNTAENAADVNALRAALGLAKLNLYGYSYGSRLALTVMRDHPDAVRSAVLDSPLPPQAGWWEERAAATERAYRRLFDGCAADPACRAAFPQLEAHFFELVERFNRDPAAVPVTDFNTGETFTALATGEDVISSGFQALYDYRIIPYLPLAIEQVHGGNLDVAAGLASGLAGDLSVAYSGMWFSVECSDEAPFNAEEKVLASLQEYPRWRSFVLGDPTPAVCEAWGVPAAGAIENEPVYSDIPALALVGEYDPIHPPAWAEATVATLDNGALVELPGLSHGVGFFGCGQALAAEFFADPLAALDTSCAAELTGPHFVTKVALNRGVYPLAAGLLLDPQPARAGMLLAIVLPFLSTAVWLRRPARRAQGNAPRGARIARLVAGLGAALGLLYVAGLLTIVVQTGRADPYLLLFGLPPESAPLLALPWLSAGLGAATAAGAALAWRRRWWTAAGRAHYTLAAAAALGFPALLAVWRLWP